MARKGKSTKQNTNAATIERRRQIVAANPTLIEVLVRFEAGVPIGAMTIHLPTGSQEIVVGVVMVLMLIRRPAGLMRGRDWSWPTRSTPATTSLKAH